MATTPVPSNFQPHFKRVSQGDDRHADLLAVIANLCGKQINEVRTQAEAVGIPKTGPYYQHIVDGTTLAKILVHFGWVATVWKDCTSYQDVSDLAIVGVDADLDYEVSRYVLFHRMRSADGKTAQPYVVDPYPHADSRLHTRVGMADLAGLAPSWYLGLTQMQKAVGK